MDVEQAASMRECSRRHLGRARAHLKGFRSVLTQTQNMAKQLRKKKNPRHHLSPRSPGTACLSPGEVGDSLETQADTTIVHDADIGIPGIESKVSFSISVGDFEDDGGQDEDRFDLDVFCERGTFDIIDISWRTIACPPPLSTAPGRLTQDASFQIEKDPRITDIQGFQKDVEWEWMRDGLSSVQEDQEGSFSSEVRDE